MACRSAPKGRFAYPTGIGAVTAGTTQWPTPLTGSLHLKGNDPEAIDDLWHAAINSRGKYFNAQNAQQLAESVVSALADFTDQAGTGHGRRDCRRAAYRDHQFWLQDELRSQAGGVT